MKTIKPSFIKAVCLFILMFLVSLPSRPAKAASFVVNTTDDMDDGVCSATHCSLREAINAANANPGPDEISFDIPGDAPHLIVLGTTLPALTDDATMIDGTTEPGYSGQPVVGVRACGVAVLLSCPAYALGLPIQSSDNVVRGLSWFGFGVYTSSGPWLPDTNASSAIDISAGSGNRIEGNRIGLDPGGVALGNSTGLRLRSPGQAVSGNVLSGNKTAIHVLAADQVIQGNLIGTDPTGHSAMPNIWGIFLDANSGPSLIGGADVDEANLISGNETGVFIGHESTGNEVYGNLIGTNTAGNAAVPNSVGIMLVGHENHIGGPSSGEGNLISGNLGAGLLVSSSSQSCWIQGNRIGSDATGAAAIPNSVGIESEGSTSTIGSQWPGEGNLILGNLHDGINLNDLAVHNWVVGNIIQLNGGAGIHTTQGPAVYQNNFSLNSIFDNGGLGIWVEHDTNEDIQPPTLSMVTLTSAHGTACPHCTVELFIADPDPTGAGEGRTHLVMVSAGADGSFNATFSGVAACDWITATNTDTEGNTSEFSSNRRTCITMPWYWLALIVSGLLAAGALVGVAGSRRWRWPRTPAIVAGGVTGAIVGMALTGTLLGLHVAAPQGPLAHLPRTRPTLTLASPVEEVQATLDAYMTQFAETLTAQPTLTPSITPTPAQLTFTPSITPTPAQLTFTPSITPTPAPLTFTPNINAYCRFGPNRLFDYKYLAMKGQSYLMDGRNSDGTWYRIMLTPYEGCWVPFDVGTPSADISGLRELFDIPTLVPTDTPTPVVNCSSYTDEKSCEAQPVCVWVFTTARPGYCKVK
jgi:CSLREA domain-containing protein